MGDLTAGIPLMKLVKCDAELGFQSRARVTFFHSVVPCAVRRNTGLRGGGGCCLRGACGTGGICICRGCC